MGLIARVLEGSGISTVCLNLRREVTENVKPPRTLFVKFPFAVPLGPGRDQKAQRAVIMKALEILVTVTEPGIIVTSSLVWKHESA